MKESLNSDGQQFHQYQQNKQPPLTSTHRRQKQEHDIWHWKFLREILLVMIYSQIILRHVLNNCFTANQITVLNRKGFLCKLKMVRRDEQVPITHWLSMINSILNTCIEIISFMICSIHLLMTTAYFYTIWMIFMCRKTCLNVMGSPFDSEQVFQVSNGYLW
jgi:hypothetical protein